MANKKRKTTIWVLSILIAILLIIILCMYGCNKINGGASGGGGSSGGGGTGCTNGSTPCPVKQCERCQARWGVSAFEWECSGVCTTSGTCKVISGDIKNPYIKPTCSCESATDNCYRVGGYTDAMTCGGTCVNSNEICGVSITGTCGCVPYTPNNQISCASITSLLSPSGCSRGLCPIPEQTCQFDTGRGTCVCM